PDADHVAKRPLQAAALPPRSAPRRAGAARRRPPRRALRKRLLTRALRRRALAELHAVRDRLPRGDPVRSRAEQAEPSDPVFLLVGAAHPLDDFGVLELLRLAEDEGTVLTADPAVARAPRGDPPRLPALRARREEDVAVRVVEPDRRRFARSAVLPPGRDVDQLRLGERPLRRLG